MKTIYFWSLLLFLFNFNSLYSQNEKISEVLAINNYLPDPEGILGYRDRFGVAVEEIGDLDMDGINELAIGANEDDDGGTNSGAVYIVFFNADKTVRQTQKISNLYGNLGGVLSPGGNFGYSIASIGDLDGDGISDIAVGAVYDGEFGYQTGAIWVLFLNSDATVKSSQKINNASGPNLHDKSSLGSSLAVLSDLDGDGVNELAAGAYRHSTTSTLTGSVFILFMNTNGTVKNFTIINQNTVNFNNILDYEDYFAGRLDAGDLNKDGISDLIVTAHRDDTEGLDQGAFYILYLNNSGGIKSTKKYTSSIISTLNTSNYFATSVCIADDLNNDGNKDLVVGSVGIDTNGQNGGSSHIIYMGSNQEVLSTFEFREDFNECDNFEILDYDGFGVDLEVMRFPDDPNTPVFIVGSHLSDFTIQDGGKVGLYIFEDYIIAKAGEDIQLCEGTTSNLTAINQPGFQWHVIQGNGIIENLSDPITSISNLSEGTNKVIWQDINCELNSDTLEIFIMPPTSKPSLTGIELLCNQNDTEVYFQEGNYQSNWVLSDGEIFLKNDQTAQISGLNVGHNTIILQNINEECNSINSDTLNIEVLNVLPPSLPKDTIVCNTEKVSFTFKPGNYENKWYQLNSLSNMEEQENYTVLLSNIENGIYTFVLESFHDLCTVSLTDTINIISTSSTMPTLNEDIITCNKNSIEIDFKKGNFNNTWWTIEGNAYIEELSDSTGIIRNLNSGTNKIALSNTYENCDTKTDTLTIKNLEINKNDVPNVITANNDGYNETFRLPDYFSNFTNSIVIVNRWGKAVHRSENYDNSWAPHSASTHYYYMEIRECDTTVKGTITTFK